VLLCGFKQTKGKRHETSEYFDRTAAGIGHSVCVNHLWHFAPGGGDMTKDKALDLALEALERMKRFGNTFGYRSWEQNPYEQVCEAIAAIKQASSVQKRPQNCGTGFCSCIECVMEPVPVQPVATVQCINGVTIGYLDVMQPLGTKLYTTPPAAQPAPVPEGWKLVPVEPTIEMLAALGFDGDVELAIGHAAISKGLEDSYVAMLSAVPTPPAAQRPWVGLTESEITDEFYKFEAAGAWYQFARAIEAKLKEKNT